ncbi:ABC transporter substrate-binding protein [Cohnella herbarum]|uniref:ABC transporter substrate-binding protein n=1 Tax=Cohnella herbarum TaxID=2728023 RepID=A0A7Z2VQR0_9BACL|nr:ABC transporter substrate-binding protein [Cohnella herbarum]QJD87489.1 ABC transporter substrate-binding protein [Cohnella herbarum]
MKKGKKLGTGLLALTMAFATVLSGCGNNGKDAEGETGASSPSKSASSSASAPASASAQASPGQALEPVTLKWLLPKTGKMDKADEVFAAINKITQEKINATIDINMIEIGDFVQKVSMMIAANEDFDIVFTSNWFNAYVPNVAKGAYLPLDDLLEQYAPQTISSTNKAAWDAIKVDGKIYGTPIQQIYARQSGFNYRKDLLDKYGFNPSTVSKLEDLEPYLKQLKDGEPGLFPIEGLGSYIWENMQAYYGFDTMLGARMPGVLKFDGLTALNQFESQQFKDYLNLVRDWYKKGYIQKDAATTKTNYRVQGKYGIVTDPVTKPGGDVEYSTSQAGGIEYVGYGIGERPMTTGSIQASLNAINANSKNPERALMFIDLLNSDQELYNLVLFGLEGMNYTKTADGKVEQKMDGSYDGFLNFFVGNVFNSYYTKGQPDGVWEATAKINKDAKPSASLGFAFNVEPVKNEVAKVGAVVDQHLNALASGSVDPDKVLPEFLSKMKTAGSEKIVEELQKQLDAWAATK